MDKQAGMLPFYTTIVDCLETRARETPEKLAFQFLPDGTSLSYFQLQQNAAALAEELLDQGRAGDRVLLLFQPGLEFIIAYMGCLYAGMVAVPMHPPKKNHHSKRSHTAERLAVVVDDAQSHLILANPEIVDHHADDLSFTEAGLKTCWLPVSVSERAHSDYKPSTKSSDLAFLQYTSGSTSKPKGVMVSHNNLILNLDELYRCFEHDDQSIMVSWLPHFHDLGLIYGILVPLYGGTPCYLMAPATFVRNPVYWLETISKYEATHSAAPNFAYQLCVDAVSDDNTQHLDLKQWRMACNAAEPVRVDTLRAFSNKFASAGFQSTTFSPSYGLAEATVKVSITRGPDEPHILYVSKSALAQGRIELFATPDERATPIIGCGRVDSDTKSVIVDPATCKPCASLTVGEVWVQGPSVASGYWRNEQATRDTFNAYLSSETSDALNANDTVNRTNSEKPFLRTGDLGFILDGELYLTGRLKDLIIIDGVNLYPQDIETTVTSSSDLFSNDNAAAFSVNRNGEEKLVVMQEIHKTVDLETVDKGKITQLLGKIRTEIFEQHEVAVNAIVLLPPYSIRKTTSGKIQRQANKTAFEAQQITPVYLWCSPEMTSPGEPDQGQRLPETDALKATLYEQVRQLISAETGQILNQIDKNATFADFGLSSKRIVLIIAKLETLLSITLPQTLPYDAPSIDAFINHIQNLLDPGKPDRTSQHYPPNDEFIQQKAHIPPATENDIAIIGIGCRFPESDSPDVLWENLINGVDCVSEVPQERWDINAYYAEEPQTPGKTNSRWGGFLKDIEKFDARFFGISVLEAETVDPHQRLLMEVAWETFENAKIVPSNLAGTSTGVFIGLSNTEFQRLAYLDESKLKTHTSTGSSPSVAAGRLSYLWDLRGPALTIDTACSSSLVAVHQACESLRRGESTLALAGGVNLLLSPAGSISLSWGNMLSPRGRCHSFDANADGYVRSEGCGLVLLKPLTAALADGNTIHAIIKGSSVNQDGHSSGLTAPNGLAQQALIKQATALAGISPAEIQYVETHGTGTPLGDPVEINSLVNTLKAGRSEHQGCVFGSVKSAIGHLEAAAGIAGLIKTVLCMQHEYIPANLHFRQLNPGINLHDSRFTIADQSKKWHSPRYAGVSSFGFSGTNAHVILQNPRINSKYSEYAKTTVTTPTPNQVSQQERSTILAISAKSESALSDLISGHASIIAQLINRTPSLALTNQRWADYCFTNNTSRAGFSCRCTIISHSFQNALSQLQALRDQRQVREENQAQVSMIAPLMNQRPVVWLFSGQGAQYSGMMRSLYHAYPVFKDTIDQCAKIADAHPDLYALDGAPFVDTLFSIETDLSQTKFTQPALYACEVALAKLWQSLGIQPQLVLGHSLGEFSAACIAGFFTLEQGMQLVLERGRLMQAQPAGEMLAVLSDRNQIAQLIDQHPDSEDLKTISLAADNAPNALVYSGSQTVMDKLHRILNDAGIPNRALAVSHAFHNPAMQPVVEPFALKLSELKTGDAPRDQSSTIKYPTLVSNVTANAFNDTEKLISIEYWKQHTLGTVEFRKSIEFVLSSLEPKKEDSLEPKKENSLEPGKIDSRNTNTTPVFMEIGPGNTLTQLAKKCAKNWSDTRLNLDTQLNSDTTSNKGECQRVILFSGIKAPAVTDADNQHSRIPRAELTSFLTNVAQLWEQGFQVNWQCFPGNPLDHRYSLPTYPWQRKRYWPDSQSGALQTSNPVRSQAQAGQSILLGVAQTIAGSDQHSAFMVYSNALNPEHHRYLQGHKIHGQCIFPGAAFIEMALTAATKLKYDNFETSNDILICSNAQFKRPILLDSESVTLQTHVQSSAPPNASGDQDYTLSIFSHRQTPNPGDPINDNRWLEHAQMSIQRHSAPTVIKKHSGIPSSLDLNRYPQTITGKQFYERWAYRGNQWTGDFQSIEQLWVNKQDCWGKIKFAPKEKASDAFLFHPGLLDACAQCLAPLAPEGSGAFVGHSLEKLTLWKRPSDGHFWVHSRLERPIDGTDQTVSGTILKGTFEVYDDQGRLIAQLEGLTIQFIGVEQAANAPLEHLNGHSKPDNESSLSTFIETWQDFHLPNNIDQTDPLNEPLKIAIFPIPDDLPLTPLALGALNTETAPDQVRCINPDTADQEIGFSQLLVPLDFSAIEESATGLAPTLNALSLLLTRINQYKSGTNTRKIWLIIKSDATTMDQALLAFTRAYSAEHPDSWGGIVLIRAYFDESSLSSIFDLITYRHRESPPVTALNQYLFNSGIFKAPVIEQIRLDLKDNTGPNLPVNSSGTYLITGGLGGLGLVWADWLAKQGAKRIVLLGRTPLPDRRDWPALLESAALELKKEREAINTILTLEENGVSITVQSVDVGNYTAFSQWLELWHKTHPAIRGVIHAAGVATPCDVEAISEQFLYEQLAAKIDGVRALADFKAEDSFDFLLLFSSVSALLPSPHLSAYAAANAWLSGFAESRENTLSVQWGAFSDRGMLAHINNTGLNSLSAARLTHLLWQRSQGDSSRRVMTVVGESASLFQAQLQSAPSFEQVVIATESSTNFGERLRSQTFDKNGSEENIKDRIFNILEPLLNVDSKSINETVSLIDLGLDSLLAVELRAKIQNIYNVSIPMVSLLKGITIRELAPDIENLLKIESHPSPALEATINASLDAPYALAYNQQAQWFIHQLQPASSAYHVSFAARFSFDSQAHGLARKLESTLSLIINQHPVLKNGFFVDSDSEEPLQRPQHSDMPIPFTLSEVNDQSEDPHSSQEMLRNTVVECYQAPFDLEKPPLIRAHWIYEKSKSEQGILLLVAHHIVCDGWSLWYLIEELKRHLGGSVDKEAKPEEELTAYPLFVEQQRQYIASQKGTDLAEYWANKGYGKLEPLNLPVMRSNRGAPSPDGKAFHTSLPDLLNKQLRAQAQRCGVTLFSLMLSAYHVLLHKVCRQEQVLVGTPIHGRFDSRFLGTVGNFVNLVPVESRFRAEATVREYVQAQHAVTLDNLDHGEYPLTLIIEQSGALRTDTQNTFIQTSFIMQKPPGDAELIKLFMESEEHAPELLWGDVKLSPYLLPQQMGQFPLAMEIADSETNLNLFLKYDNHLFSAFQISQLAFAYVEILNQFACQPDKPLSEVALHAPKSELDSFNPKNKVAVNQEPVSLVSRIIKQAERHPNRPAVSDGQTSLTYSELVRKAHIIASEIQTALENAPLQNQSHLQNRGHRIGICARRTTDMICGMLGILFSGNSYLPLDARQPVQRLKYQLNDSGARLLILDKQLDSYARINEHLDEFVSLDLNHQSNPLDHSLDGYVSTVDHEKIAPDALAYVIYTSGTTGKPKGVPVQHSQVIHLVDALAKEIYSTLSGPQRIALIANTVFDASVQQIFSSLVYGHHLFVVPELMRQDMHQLAEFLAQHEITVTDCTPSLLQQLIAVKPNLSSVAALIVGGEQFPVELAQYVQSNNPQLQIFNVYGPTECCVDATLAAPGSADLEKLDRTRALPIGQPLGQTELFIVDPWYQPVGPGIQGEILIGGPSVSAGYLNRAELSERNFLNLPNLSDSKVYRTGDIGYRLANGDIQLIGREDSQVKVRGYRIELGEIESCLKQHDNVMDCAVIVRKSLQQIIAFVVLKNTSLPAPDFVKSQIIAELKSLATAVLTDYMQPNLIQVVDHIPLTSSGKLDNRLLESWSVDQTADAVQSLTPLESQIAKIWCSALGLQSIGRQDNFFDLGGHSLLLSKVQLGISKATGKDIAMVDLFANPTLGQMASLLKQENTSESTTPVISVETNKRSRPNRLSDRRNRRRQTPTA